MKKQNKKKQTKLKADKQQQVFKHTKTNAQVSAMSASLVSE